MTKTIDLLNAILEDAFVKAGYGAGFGHVNVSNRPDLCEFQCNSCMALAKKQHRKPIDIANSVVEVLKESGAFSRVSACMPGFINMDVSADFLAAQLYAMQEDERTGLACVDKPLRLIVDYGGANVAKPLHVGHLRSAVIGEAIKRIGAALGNEMTGDVHLGDWGLQMGLIIEELKDRGQTDFTLSDLEEIYPAASGRTKARDEDGNLTEDAVDFKNRALEATKRLQSGDPECMAVWKRIMALSLPDLKDNYDSLDVHFELWKGESDVQKYIPDMLDSFVKQGIAYESEGALVVDVTEKTDSKEFPPCIVRKSDGSALYATTDLATLVEREQLYHPDGYIYIADQRQSLHYQSFFRVARKAGITGDNESLRFLGFGTMNGRDGKPFKTREGGVMRLKTLVGDINEAVYDKIRCTRDEEEIPEEEARRTAAMVGLSALKYGDLSNQASKDYVFDIDRFTNFDGNTGPYILYTIVRIRSILRKYDLEPSVMPGTDDAAGAYGGCMAYRADESLLSAGISRAAELKAMALVLTRYSETVEQAWEQLAPHKICQFIYELSNAFSTFYHNVRILQEEDAGIRKAYIAMLALTLRVLLRCIDMLGFSAPERM